MNTGTSNVTIHRYVHEMYLIHFPAWERKPLSQNLEFPKIPKYGDFDAQFR